MIFILFTKKCIYFPQFSEQNSKTTLLHVSISNFGDTIIFNFSKQEGVIFPENIHSCEAVLSQGSLNLTGISLIKMFNFTLLFIQLVILSIYVIVMGIIKFARMIPISITYIVLISFTQICKSRLIKLLNHPVLGGLSNFITLQ